ncbi:MAG: hypothetical protein ACFFB3_06765, partial [Candidatus Hodarchaeota archaeon]
MTRLELIRDSLQELLSNFIPISIVIKNKKLQLSEETLQNIQDAESAIEYVAKASLPLPRSTFELCHYGTAIRDKIFPNVEEYQVEQSTKRLARRKGSWQLKLIGWNEKKIKFDIIKYPEPEWEGKKPEKDEKIFRRLMKDWPVQLEKKAIAECESKILLFGNIFINPSSSTTQKVKELDLALKTYKEVDKAYKETNKKLESAHEKHQVLLEAIRGLNAKIQALNKNLSQTTEYQSLITAQEQLQHLQEDRKTRSFLKIWRDLLHRYIRWAQRELGSQLPLKELLSIEEDILDVSVGLEDLYDDISAEFIARADILYPQRKQFAKKIGSKQQLRGRLENGKSVIYELRQLQKTINGEQKKLAAIFEFQEAKKLTNELNEVKEKLESSKKEFHLLERSASELKAQF